MATKMTICGKSYEEYLADKKAKHGTLHVKRGKQVQNIGGVKMENIYKDSDIVPVDGDFLVLGEAVLEKDGKQVELNGRIEMKDGVWFENGNKINI